jgi:prephenate dehydrogenase
MRPLPMLPSENTGGEPPLFDKIAILGLGLIGGSIALAARRRWPAGLVIAVDEKRVLERAMVMHAIDVAADDPVVIREADLVVLAAPVRQNLRLLGQLAGHLPESAVVTDVGSTKRGMVEAARALPSRLAFVGGHPLAGAARSGIEHARPDLFEGRPWLLTPDENRGAEAVERLCAFVSGLCAEPRLLDAAAHDRLVAYLSHLPQLAASALMHVVGEGAGEAALPCAGRGLVDTTRLASSPADVWQDICATNGDQIGDALDTYIAVLRQLREDLAGGGAVARVFDSAGAWRERLLAAQPRRS